LGAGVVAILAARILALTLPFRVRPRFEPALHFVVPAGNVSDLVDWSAFPSDHAAIAGARVGAATAGAQLAHRHVA
jgi:undecaprenyl-diphosphatase